MNGKTYRFWSDEDRAKAAEMYRDGVKLTDIAAHFGRNRGSVTSLLYKKLRVKGERYRKPQQERDHKVFILVANGWTVNEVALHMGLNNRDAWKMFGHECKRMLDSGEMKWKGGAR